MIPAIDLEQVASAIRSDKELAYKLRDWTGTVRVDVPGQAFDVEIEGGAAGTIRPADGDADVTITAPEAFWATALAAPTPPPGHESLTVAMTHGAKVVGPFPEVVPAWYGGFERLYKVVREAVAGPTPRAAYDGNPFKDTDTAVGRYHYISAGGVEARVYVEQAGTGPIPLMLQATAGADSRQYRHLLADPAMQERFTMYAYDLPYHGRSGAPTSVRWWEQAFLPTRDWFIDWTVAIADALGLEQPFFMGCSVGGQLALDLAAERPDRFGAFIALNGWYAMPPIEGFTNEAFRTPAISDNYGPSLNFGATAPGAPEPTAHEAYWVYRTGFPGVYAGDNDYFMTGHDLRVNGHKIDAHAKPVYAIAGEYDLAAHDTEYGVAAIERNVPGAVAVTLEGLGHFAPCDDPIGFSRAIVPVLDEVIAKTNAIVATA